jgi:hypothetical protein
MNGVYRVKNPDLRVLHEQAKGLADRFKEVVFRHVPREANRETDNLCNEALDEAVPKNDRSSARNKLSDSSSFPGRIEAVREEAIQCLQSVATSWANGGPSSPSPEAVWDQLWSILEENEVVRQAK